MRYAKAAAVIFSSLALGIPIRGAAAQIIQVAGVGAEGQGADLVILDLDSGAPDMILMAYDNPPGGNSFRYRVGRNLSSSGVALGGWSTPVIVPGLGSEGQGAGMAVTNLDTNYRPDLILVAYDNPPGPNNFRYIVGRNLNANGIPPLGWTPVVSAPGVGWEGDGAAAVAGFLDNNGRPELILIAYDGPPGPNNFRYIIGRDLDMNGVATGWSTPIIVPGLGWEGQGLGAALVNLDSNARPELVLMAYDSPPGANNFRYTIGWNLNVNGVAVNWTSGPQLPGVGWEGQGAGLAITCLDGNAQGDWIVMAYDAPPGANSFRYYVRNNHLPGPSCGIP